MKMKTNNKIMRIIMAVLLALSAGLAFFRFDMLKDNKAIDSIGLYTDKSAGNLFGTLVFVLIAITVVFAFLLKKNTFESKKSSVLFTASSVICMLLVLTVGISGIYELIQNGKQNAILTAEGALGVGTNWLLVIETALAFVSVAYFLYEVIKGARTEVSGILALIPVVWLAMRAIRLFMNIETQINSSARSFTLLFIVVTMMFFIYEAELSIPKGKKEITEDANATRYAKLTGFGLVCAELAIIFALAPIAAGGLDLTELVYGFADITLALFALVRVFSLSIKSSEE